MVVQSRNQKRTGEENHEIQDKFMCDPIGYHSFGAVPVSSGGSLEVNGGF
jgi:hypothetical protein